MDGRDGETEELSVETDEVQVDSPRGCNALQLLCCSSTAQLLLNFYSISTQLLLNYYFLRCSCTVVCHGLQGQNNKKLCSVNFLKRGEKLMRKIHPPQKREEKGENL